MTECEGLVKCVSDWRTKLTGLQEAVKRDTKGYPEHALVLGGK